MHLNTEHTDQQQPSLTTVETQALQDLIERDESARELEHTARQATLDRQIKQIVSQRAGRRARFAAELRALLRRRHEPEPPPANERTLSKLHRDWTAFAHFIDGDKPTALVTELRRRDASLIDSYDQAIQLVDEAEAARTLATQREELIAEQSLLDRVSHTAH